MKLLVFMNMPAGAAMVPAAPFGSVQGDVPAVETGYLTHQIILDVPSIGSLRLLPQLVGDGYLIGEHMVYERVGGVKRWKSRGPMLINMAHVGKIAPFFEGGAR